MHAPHQRLPLALTATAAAQGYKMRDETLYMWYHLVPSLRPAYNSDHDGGIRTAVRVWFEDPAAAKAKYGPIASWDTSGITNMDSLFYNKKDFNEDISHWNVSNAWDMDLMFCGATSFTGDLSSWNVGQVKNMHFMFHGATSFTGDLSRWDVGQVKYMASMFHGATKFTGDLSNWKVGQVEYMNHMFSGATSFTGDLSNWDVGQVKNMDIMFSGATSFTHQLGGAWSTSTIRKSRMFDNSPGTIAGKVKQANGTIE